MKAITVGCVVQTFSMNFYEQSKQVKNLVFIEPIVKITTDLYRCLHVTKISSLIHIVIKRYIIVSINPSFQQDY